MDCLELRRITNEPVDRATPSSIIAITKHLAMCPACQEYWVSDERSRQDCPSDADMEAHNRRMERAFADPEIQEQMDEVAEILSKDNIHARLKDVVRRSMEKDQENE